MIIPQDGRLRLDRERLKQHRKRLGLSQEALAEYCFDRRLCVSIASIKRAESGKAVLYRTARHLAEIYEVEVEELSAEAEEAAVVAADIEEMESARVLIQLHAVAADPSALASWVQHFGGSLEEGGTALFGLPRAYRSDAQRGLLCAATLVEQGWPAACIFRPAIGPRLCRFPCRVGRAACGSSVVWRCSWRSASFSMTKVASGCAIASPETRLMTPASSWWGAGYSWASCKPSWRALQAYQAGHLIYIRGVAGIGKTRLSAEFAEMAAAHADHHQAEVLDFGTRADEGPLMQLARSLLQTSAEAQAEILDEALLLARLSALRLPMDHAMLLRPLLGLPQSEEAQSLYAAMTPRPAASAWCWHCAICSWRAPFIARNWWWWRTCTGPTRRCWPPSPGCCRVPRKRR